MNESEILREIENDELDAKLKHDISKTINECKSTRHKLFQRCQTSILNPSTSSEKIPIFQIHMKLKAIKERIRKISMLSECVHLTSQFILN